jgi:hypothetical protein
MVDCILLLLLLHDRGVLEEPLEETDDAAGLVQGIIQVTEGIFPLALHCLTALLSAKLSQKFIILGLYQVDLGK